MPFGTNTTLDTLAAHSTTTVVQFGEDRAYDAIEQAFRVHNAIMDEVMADLVERTTDRLRRYGGVDSMVMEPLDQFGRPDAQKISAGSNVGFPLRKHGASLQWTRSALEEMTVGQLLANMRAMFDADVVAVTTELKRALFFATNYTFADVLVDNVDLAVKRLLNADSAPIPLGPWGEAFTASSHTHYLARAGGAWANTDLSALIDTVIEHFGSGQALVYINKAQEAAVKAFSGFTAYLDPRLVPSQSSTHAAKTLDVMDMNNRAIGLYDEAEVWVKPWVPANYAFAWVLGQPKPLVFREKTAGKGNLRMVANDELHPLRAESFEREFGVGVWTRTNGAVQRIDNTTYADPSL